jgi:hypothetical protein
MQKLTPFHLAIPVEVDYLKIMKKISQIIDIQIYRLFIL